MVGGDGDGPVRLQFMMLGAALALGAGPVVASTLIIPPATAVAMRIVVAPQSGPGVRRGPADLSGTRRWRPRRDAYALELARTGRWGHSPSAARPGQGENLWMGTRGAFSIDQMVGAWAAEGRWFRRGALPGGQRDRALGSDVGHYSQMIWPGSDRVGCAVRSSARSDYLVCRYSPAGNIVGITVP